MRSSGGRGPDDEWLEQQRRRAMRSPRRRTTGLLEMLLVVALVAYLAATFAPRVLRVADYARTTMASGAAGELQTALQRYALDHGDYPQIRSYDDLVRLLGPYVTLPGDPALNNWRLVAYSYRGPEEYSLTISVGGSENPVTVVIRPGSISR